MTLLLPLSAVSCGTTDSALSFGECPAGIKGLECTTVGVPLDYADAAGPQLTIALSRLRASGPADRRRGVLLVNPGGPGNSGLEYAAYKGAKLPQAVREAFDVIGFDPRGVGIVREHFPSAFPQNLNNLPGSCIHTHQLPAKSVCAIHKEGISAT